MKNPSIKKTEIDEVNIHDFIRQEKKKGLKELEWDIVGYETLRNVVSANADCGFSLMGDIDLNIFSKCIKNHDHRPTKDGFTFMGVKHFEEKLPPNTCKVELEN